MASESRTLRLDVHTTTGGAFSVTADALASVDHLKKLVSQRLRVPKERICLLHRDRQLRDGTLEDNGLADGSRIILLPSVETGLLTQRPENSVMQALETLNDTQVNDFLSGKSPLNLTMRLGNHVMLIQLQLSTYPGGKSSSSVGKSRISTVSQRISKCAKSTVKCSEDVSNSPNHSNKACSETKGCSYTSMMDSPHASTVSNTDSDISEKVPLNIKDISNVNDIKSFLCEKDIETLENAFVIFKSLAEMQENVDKDAMSASLVTDECDKTLNICHKEELVDNSLDSEEQSPIKSLSNLVSSPLKSSLTSYSTASFNAHDALEIEDKSPKCVSVSGSMKNDLFDGDGNEPNCKSNLSIGCPMMSDPIAANLTSCLCSALNSNDSCYAFNNSTFRPKSPNAEMDIDHKNDKYDLSANLSDKCDVDDVNTIENEDCVHSNNLKLNSNKLSIVCNELNDKTDRNDNDTLPSSSLSHVSKAYKNKRLHYLLHKSSKSEGQVQNKSKASSQLFPDKHSDNKECCSNSSDVSMQNISLPSCSDTPDSVDMSSIPSTSKCNDSPADLHSNNSACDTKSLVEASKNLTQTLKKLSKEVLKNKIRLTRETRSKSKISQGAVIESMKHHGKGIYSGTFSGILNPALQDRFGRPKKDISTIIHILNDLLCATPPQYRRDARITFEPTHNTSVNKARQQLDLRQSSPSSDTEHEIIEEYHCTKCINSINSCPYGECDGHYTTVSQEKKLSPNICDSTGHTDDNITPNDKCSCNIDRLMYSDNQNRIFLTCDCCGKNFEKVMEEKIAIKKDCNNCHSASLLASDNSKTKCKLDQLRLVMQQKKQRREARKIKSAPYPSINSTTVNINPTDSPSVIAEEIETVA